MKAATVTEVIEDFPAVLRWVEGGEQVQVLHEGHPVAFICPVPHQVRQPDYLARLKKNFGDKVVSVEASAALRDFNRGEG
jgi:antitoxin (DNA-binding transcriptional repressor) of toxin-antitoxin stability system